jgi:hypothetical protein
VTIRANRTRSTRYPTSISRISLTTQSSQLLSTLKASSSNMSSKKKSKKDMKKLQDQLAKARGTISDKYAATGTFTSTSASGSTGDSRTSVETVDLGYDQPRKRQRLNSVLESTSESDSSFTPPLPPLEPCDDATPHASSSHRGRTYAQVSLDLFCLSHS